MKNLALIFMVLIAMPVFSQGILTEAYKSELQQNIEETEALLEAGLATEREVFMLGYYKKKLIGLQAEASGSPHRAQFTTIIKNREPVDELGSITTAAQQVSFFTELRNLNGRIATHRWSVSGNVIYTKDFKVGANRWRVWSTKTITPYKGKMVVVQVLVDGKVVEQESIRVN